MSWLEGLFLGILQGLTEFLPVSSSGHLEIAQALLRNTGSENLTFAIMVHAATVLSTLVVLWSEVSQLFKGTFTTTAWNKEKTYVAKIFVSMIPVFVIGIFFKEQVEYFFGNGLLIIGAGLVVTAGLLTFAYFAKPRQKEEISYRDAFIIGLAQAVAVIPGLSRSGSTIATGIILGNKKEQVAKISFLMVLIPILGEALLELIDMLGTNAEIGISFGALFAGFLGAFLTGCIACKFMINLVKNGKLIYFAIYCAIVGTATIVFSLI